MVTRLPHGRRTGDPAHRARCVCPPLHATPRDPTRKTLGGAVAKVAKALGTPLMPWQRQVVDTALEVDPQTGLLVYSEVDLTVPRQQGKTTLELAVMVHRCRTWARSRVLYSAQSRLHAHKKWEDEHVATLKASPFAGEFGVRYQRGDEAIRWDNGSLHGITAPGEKAGHSEVLDLAVVDEAWAHEDARLEQGLSPTMVTRPQPQLWVVSTAGTVRSAYLRGKVDAGRARVAAGHRGGVAYFEWAAPDGADPADPATWRSCMPALGRTITMARIRAEFDRLDLADFCRAYLNWWPGSIPADWLVITEAAWRALADPRSEVVDPVAFAADVTPERSHAAIAVAGQRLDGLGHGEVVDHHPGTGWVVPRLVELVGRWQPCAVVVDPTGPAGSLIAPLEAAGVEAIKPTLREAAHAAGALFDAVAEATVRYVPRPALDAAVAGARQRPLGDGWAWARKGLSVDLCPLVALTLARWGHATRAHLDRGGVSAYV
jgi:Phage Terminase